MPRQPRRWVRLLFGVPAVEGSTRLEALLHARRRLLRYNLPALVLVWAIVALAKFSTAAIVFFAAITAVELIILANLQHRIHNERGATNAP